MYKLTTLIVGWCVYKRNTPDLYMAPMALLRYSRLAPLQNVGSRPTERLNVQVNQFDSGLVRL